MTDSRSYVRTTHEVQNQPPELGDFDAYQLDLALQEAVAREAASWVGEKLAAYGPVAGSAEMREHARLANRHAPELRTHDRYGHRIDEVLYHPAYHALMEQAMRHEVHSAAWTASAPGGHVAHASLLYLHSQLEAGTACPLTMTHAAVPCLGAEPAIERLWKPRLLHTRYDARCIEASRKHSATLGMAMTEKQGGSDVRANTTRAVPLGKSEQGDAYLLTGHKWFCSAPMSDAFLTLAQTETGLTCFLVPRFTPDGKRNRFLIQRLKDKLGNRANASSEIEYDETWALRVGEAGRGVATILQMVAQTRVDCAAGSAGLMRAALVEAIHHVRHRAAFGRTLIDQPLMRAVLCDLAVEAEAALILALRVARSYDQADSEAERLFGRVATPLAKYWVTRRATGFIFEAMECLGGAGYVEESTLPRLYREAPVNSIWEGSGNVQCLDLLRVLRKEPDAAEALLAEIDRAGDARLQTHSEALREALTRTDGFEPRARQLLERASLCLSASLMVRYAPTAAADAYIEARLGPGASLAYGNAGDSFDAEALLERALPSG